MMTDIMIAIVGVCSLSSYLVSAMTVTKYQITTPSVPSDNLVCGTSASPLDFCAARVTSDSTCEPLTRDWCELKDMSMAGSYLIKQTIKHVPEITNTDWYALRVPIYMSVGSEVEMKFMVRAGSGWNNFRCLLNDTNGNAVLRTAVYDNIIYMLWHMNDGFFQDGVDKDRIQFPGQQYILTIRCGVNSFDIFLNGEFIRTYSRTPLPASSITDMNIQFDGPNGDLFYVAFKAGQ